MPLLPHLVPRLLPAAQYRLHVPSRQLQSLQYIRTTVILYVSVVYRDYRRVHPREHPRLLHHRLKHHALVLTQKREHHVQVYETLGLVRQLLHQYRKLLVLLRHLVSQILYTLLVRSDARPYTQHVASRYLHVATLRPRMAAPFLRIQRLHSEKLLEYRLVYQRLPPPHVKRHRVNQHTVIHRAARIPREKQVIQRLQVIAVVILPVLIVPIPVLYPLYQLLRKHTRLMSEQPLRQSPAPVQPATLRHYLPLHPLILQHLRQHILHIIYLRPPLQHTAEIRIFLIHNRFVQYVAVQRTVRILRRHPLYLHPRTMQQHRPQPTRLRAHIYLYFLLIILHCPYFIC